MVSLALGSVGLVIVYTTVMLLTGLPVLLVVLVEPMHPLQQLPLLTAARVVDKVTGQNLFELPDRQVLNGLLIVQIRQRGPHPPLCHRADLQRGQRRHLE